MTLLMTGGDVAGRQSTAAAVSASFSDVATITRLQDDAQLALNRYIDAARRAIQPFRFGKLLLLLSSLRYVSADTIEHMYFQSTLGAIPVSRIVSDMFDSADP